MTENCLAAAHIEQLVKKVKMLVPIPQYSLFKSPAELQFIGQGLFKIVFRYDDKAIKYFKFGPIKEKEVEKLKALSRLDTFEQLYMHGERWIATEYIAGEKLKHADKVGISLNKQAVEKVREDMLTCLALGWSPNDLHFGNFLVESSGRIRCIDVDLFKDIRGYDGEKQAWSRKWALQRIEGLYQKMLRFVR